MRIVASSLVAAGTVAGIAGAVVAYQSASSVADQRPTASSVAPSPEPVPAQVRFLPCDPGTKLIKGVCVRVKHKVVVHVVPAAPQAVAAPAEAPRPAPRSARGHSRDDSRPATRPVRHETSDDSVDEADHASEDEHEVEHEDEGFDD